ncbi:MAG: hypothetical protein AAF744_14845 [Pseudomonadota bacterium]
MQLIIHYSVTDYTAWKEAFDADHEARTQAGLSLLQVWRHADSAQHAFALMEVNDRARAESWITRSNALSTDDAGTVTEASHFFIETA